MWPSRTGKYKCVCLCVCVRVYVCVKDNGPDPVHNYFPCDHPGQVNMIKFMLLSSYLVIYLYCIFVSNLVLWWYLSLCEGHKLLREVLFMFFWLYKSVSWVQVSINLNLSSIILSSRLFVKSFVYGYIWSVTLYHIHLLF